MQPCHVCGGMAVDAAHYCTGCRAYRGPVARQGYPAYAPPPAEHSPYLVPLIGLCVALVIVAVGIVIVLAVKKGDHAAARSDQPPAVAAGGSAAIDPCLVGSWRVTTATQRVSVPGIGEVRFDAQAGAQTTVIHPDGTAEDDYGSDSAFEGSSGGHTYTLAVAGTVYYVIRTANGTITFVSPSATGSVVLSVDGTSVTSVPLSVNSDPTRYTCSGSTFTEHTETYDATLTRQS